MKGKQHNNSLLDKLQRKGNGSAKQLGGNGYLTNFQPNLNTAFLVVSPQMATITHCVCCADFAPLKVLPDKIDITQSNETIVQAPFGFFYCAVLLLIVTDFEQPNRLLVYLLLIYPAFYFGLRTFSLWDGSGRIVDSSLQNVDW